MTELLDRNIKEIIREYPALEKILAEFSIGCTACSLGTCMLKDIVEIHNLSPDHERLLMTRIAEAVYPGQTVAIPIIARTARQKSNDSKLSPPLQDIVKEHSVIKRVLALIPKLLADMDEGPDGAFETCREALNFIRDYADEFHHAKEEKTLFSYFDANSDIIASFVKEHETGRTHVRAARKLLAENDLKSVREHLTAFSELLTEHIKKEDEILYPWMNRILSDHQVGGLFAEFSRIDRGFFEKAGYYADWVSGMEKEPELVRK